MKTIKNLVIILSLVLAGSLLFGGSRAKAQEQTENYDYVASKGDNLTYVVRDAINQYCRDNGEELNAAQRVYTETNIVNDMGAYWLDVNQQVHVSKPKIKQYTDSAKNLDASTQAAWQRYADTTSIQSIIDGGQTNTATNKQAQEEAAKQAQQTEADKSESGQAESKSDDSQKQDDQKSEEQSNSGQKSWLSQNWAKLVLAGLIASLVYKIISDNQNSKKA